MELFETWLVNSYILDGGIENKYLDNTLPTYLEAIDGGCPLKIDVQILGDGTVICFKNSKLKSHTDTNGYVTHLTNADIETIVLKDGNKIPLFEEAINLINGKVPVVINIINNTSSTKLESIVAKTLKKYDGQFAVVSTNPISVNFFKENYPDFNYGIKVDNFEAKLEGNFKTKRLKKLKYNKFCSPKFVMYYSSGLPNRSVNKYKNLPLIATDITSQEEYLKMVKYCDNISFNSFKPEI